MATKMKQKKHRKFWLVIKVMILIMLLTVLAGGLFMYFKYARRNIYHRYIPKF